MCLLTRLVELVVHADDLAVTLRVPTPEFGDRVEDLVVTTLARMARGRRGTLPLLRALARRERAPSNDRGVLTPGAPAANLHQCPLARRVFVAELVIQPQ